MLARRPFAGPLRVPLSVLGWSSPAPPLAICAPRRSTPANSRTLLAPHLPAAPARPPLPAQATRRGLSSCCRAPPRAVLPTLAVALPPLPPRPPRPRQENIRRAASSPLRPPHPLAASHGRTRGWSLASRSAVLPPPPLPALAGSCPPGS